MAKTTITVIPGDGVGPEITAATLRVLSALGCGLAYEEHLAGVAALEAGQALVPGACFAGIKPLQVAVGRHFAASQRAFKSSKKGGSKQKIYQCAGEAGGCKAEVRANKNSSGEWHVHKVHSDHTGCSGGNTTGRSSAFSAVARQALNDNPEL